MPVRQEGGFKEGIMKPRTVDVYLRVTAGRLECDPAIIEVYPGDGIVWKWAGGRPFPFGLVIKSPFSPLENQFYVNLLKKRDIEMRTSVLPCAPPGRYPYLVAAFVDGKLLVEDPEIIVRPPVKDG